jgi:hypothetical protein
MNAIREIATVKQDGSVEVRHPALAAGEQVEVIVLLPSPKPPEKGEPYAFLKVLREANLEGPSDWSEHLDDYLYRGKPYDGKPGIS